MRLHFPCILLLPVQGQDLQRAGINNKWWVVNACLSLTNTENSFLQAKAQSELTWIKKVEELSKGNTVLIEWKNL